MKLQGDPSKVALSFIPVEGQPFTEALRAEVKEATRNPWDLQVHVSTTAPIESGDILLATYYFRTETLARGERRGADRVRVRARPRPLDQIGVDARARGPRMEEDRRPVPRRDGLPGRRGAGEFPAGLPAADHRASAASPSRASAASWRWPALPTTRNGYRGMEPDAAWRKAAAERIEKLRKGSLRVVVKDRAGRPVAGADVAPAPDPAGVRVRHLRPGRQPLTGPSTRSTVRC